MTAARLREVLRYCKTTGKFTWLVSKGRCAVGETAGAKDGRGYITIRIDGVQFWAHRLAVLYVTGNLPEKDVDHVNGVKSDNRWTNLRCVSRSVNLRNQRRKKSVTLGVAWDGSRSRWVARIKVEGKTINLGRFTSKRAAVVARKEAERSYGFHPKHGNKTQSEKGKRRHGR